MEKNYIQLNLNHLREKLKNSHPDENDELLTKITDLQKQKNSLKNISEELDGEIKISVKEKNKFTGFNAFKKAIDISKKSNFIADVNKIPARNNSP